MVKHGVLGKVDIWWNSLSWLREEKKKRNEIVNAIDENPESRNEAISVTLLLFIIAGNISMKW